MGKADMRVRALLAEDLVIFLSDSENSIVCSDLGLLIDGLLPWLTGSHFKIAQRALEAFTELIIRLGPDFNAYTPTVLPHVVDRLGDSKDTVREKAQLLLHKLMEAKVLSPQVLLDKLTTCFKHKNSKVREEYLQTIVNTLNEYGTQSLSLKNYITPIVVLLGDPTSTVRDAANQTLVEIYKHVGDRLRVDLRKKDVPTTKMAVLEQKFDEIKSDGLLLPSALNSNTNTALTDETDTAPIPRPTRLVKRAPSASSAIGRKTSTTDAPYISSGGDLAAGAVSADIFEATFELVPQLTIFGPRDVEDVIKNINTIIGDKTMDWEKRVDALKKIRSLLIMNIHNTATFPTHLKDLSIAFLDILKELRSQVIREACITIAYMSKIIQNKLDQFCIYILQEMINLIQNSAKVISSAGTIALKYVIRYTQAPKIVPIIAQNLLQSKSKDIRATLSEILVILLDEWQTKYLERSANVLRDAVKKGITDADGEARKHSRRAFWSFKKHFSELADAMYMNLDPAAQKALDKERDTLGINAGFRSVSAVDTAAAQRAKARAQYSNLARLKVTSGTASLPRVKKNNLVGSTPTSQQPLVSEQKSKRSRSGVSQSQPTSRSTSPSSRLRDANPYYYPHRQTGTVPKKTSGIPRSLANSRETSPTRSTSGSYKRSLYTTGSGRRPDRPPINPGRPILAQKILQQSREAENALASALSPDEHDFAADFRLLNRKISKDESDESEASSVCSEKSFDSYRRGDYSLNGSRSRLDSYRPPIDDIDTIIQYCASTHWSERKDGLISLTQYLSEGKLLTQQQLQCVLELFRKMFMDVHTKVYSLFLDAVNELILSHSNDLHDWLFILLTRLFNKLGTDLLASMYGKIWKTLQIVYEYFPRELQVQAVFHILCDAAQTPNLKTKIATLKFLTTLATTYSTGVQFTSFSTADKALLKISQHAIDQKSVELRSQAKLCIVALYSCNTPDMVMLMNRLPKSLQDTLKSVIQQNLRRSTSGNDSPSPLSCSSPKPLLSPQQGGQYFLQSNSSPRSRQSSVEGSDPMNTEEIYRNLRKTTAEIQNYSFETKLDRDTNSKDSGISQMGDHLIQVDQYIYSTNGFNGHIGLDKEDSCNGSKTQSATTTESNTPENTVRMDSMDSANKTITPHRRLPAPVTFTESGELVTEKGVRESDIIATAITLTQDTNQEIILTTLGQLSLCIAHGNCQLVIKNFKAIMKMLLNLMESNINGVIIASLMTLSKILKSEHMRQSWSNFRELILLKIIDCYKTKEVSREIDSIIPKIAAVLPLDESINILKPVTATGGYPSNLCALNMLIALVDHQGKDLTESHLDSIMPNITRLTEDSESMVRKSAVFCIVKLYVAMGEDKVKPKLASLTPSKLRLLHVYIKKAQSISNSSKSSSS